MVRLSVASLAAVVGIGLALGLAGCKTENPAFCANPANAGIDGCPGDATSGGACASNGDCKIASLPACDLAIANGTCKACTATDKGVCAGKTPHCDSTDTCVACVDDTNDCAGGVCLADGGCAATTTILHATSTSNKMTSCGDAANPCSLQGAIGLAAPGKDVIKLDDAGPFAATGGGGFTITNDLTLDARGATLTRSGAGPILTISSGKTATLLGGTVQGVAGGNDASIKCSSSSTLSIIDTVVETADLSGITADMCTLNIARATLRGNSAKPNTYVPAINVNNGSLALTRSHIDSNNGGGLVVTSSTIVIVSNVFSSNGAVGTVANPNPSAVGAMNLQLSAGSNLLEFNTIVGNHASIGGNGPGIQCVLAGFTARNNILWMNNDNATAATGGNCIHNYSEISGVLVDANNNTHVDPMLSGDFHLLGPSNPMIGKADPATDLGGPAATDIDGQPRVARTGMGADIGADQYYPAN